MEYECEIWVPGVPQQKGSKVPVMNRKTGKMWVRDQNPDAKAWEDRIRIECLDVKPPKPLTVAMSVDVQFYYLRPPTSHRKNKTTAPDLDKLVRCVLDAMTGHIYDDDSQVIFVRAKKQYCNDEQKTPGAHIRVCSLEPYHDQKTLFGGG